MTERLHNPFRTPPRTLALLLTLAAVAAVVAPVATAHGKPPLRSSQEEVNLNIYDAYLSQQCGVEVVATLSGTEQRRIYRGDDPVSPARELTTFDGEITWLARTTGKS